MGIACTLGDTLEAFTDALRTGRCAIRSINAAHSDLPVRSAALLPDTDWLARLNTLGLPSTMIESAQAAAQRAPRVVQTAVYCALSAWQQAGLHEANGLDTYRSGLIIAGQNLSSRYIHDQRQRLEGEWVWLPASFGLHCLDTDLVGILSEILTLHGPGFTVGGASASGNVGLIQGQQLILSGQVDRCVVVGALADLSPLELQAWKNMGAVTDTPLPANESCRPFDRDHAGFVYGQGCGCLILENRTSLQSRGATSQARLAGAGFALDGNRSANPSVSGEAHAIKQALQEAGISTMDIAYINTHGTGSMLGDVTEIAAIKDVFREQLEGIWLNSSKGLTGHCLYAAGVIEAIATVLQMRHGFVHPNKNLNAPIDVELCFTGDTAKPAEIPAALSNSFGFGGINTAIVLTQIG
jgi:malonyl-ACP decarboxylase